MLTHLFVSNYALIDELSLDLSDGLTIITGETGAGKSILLGALKLVLGERADLKSIKSQENKCIVEAHFDISKLKLKPFFAENDLDYEDVSILRREILPSGKSRAFVNDVPVVLNVLNSLSSILIDIHSQFETANLLKESFQFDWVDAVANQQKDVADFYDQLQIFQLKQKELSSLEKQKAEFQKEFEYNSFLFEELTAAQLEDISFEELEAEQHLLENAEEIAANLSESIQVFENEEYGIILNLNQILNKSRTFPDALKQRIQALKIETNDVVTELNQYLEKLEINPEKLIEIQDRLNLVNQLFAKHQVQEINDLIDIREKLSQKLEDGFNVDSTITKLNKEISLLNQQLLDKAAVISAARQSVIPGIEREVVNSMKKLGMPNSVLKFNLQQTDDFNAFGRNKIDLKFTANKGMEPRNIDKAVSGGERSRLMLAVKESVAKHRELPTLILDEIDTGVSGKIAQSIGEIMADAANHLQIIAITHLPQVAAFGNHHLKVMKSESGNSTATKVIHLNEKERNEEIAQMLSGKNITDAAKEQAKQLLNQKMR